MFGSALESLGILPVESFSANLIQRTEGSGEPSHHGAWSGWVDMQLQRRPSEREHEVSLVGRHVGEGLARLRRAGAKGQRRHC